MKRHFTCGIVDGSDCFAYCGTKTGDVFEVCEKQNSIIFKIINLIYTGEY